MGGPNLCDINQTHSQEVQSLQLPPSSSPSSSSSGPVRLSSGHVPVFRVMAGRRQRWKPLQLLIILSLLILTNQFEMRDVQEKLSRDTAAELHLRGTSHAETQELLKISESR
ncbi:hypothetical protein ATANTOWER_028470 [Ataeniobius toweri]|uniref:Uncharacterized protein n=1 Tax=Ataeniobius toweri TaxID=208326 RepID=A0ABU7CJC3_9TELE|nr:hypothetical protein [Ataeniobius toweri]